MKPKPCPFCGNTEVQLSNHTNEGFRTNYFYLCIYTGSGIGCGAEGPYRKSESEALEAWNRRIETFNKQDLIEVVEEFKFHSRGGDSAEDLVCRWLEEREDK